MYFSSQGQLSVLSLISVYVPTPCYHSSTYKIPVILPKVQVAVTASYVCGFLRILCMLHMHPTYVASNKVAL